MPNQKNRYGLGKNRASAHCYGSCSEKAATHPVSDLKMLSKIAPFIDTDLSKSEIMSLAFKIIGNVSEAFSSRHAHSTEHGNTQQEAAPPS